ncbi:IS110 family transposase, partial [Streptomyces sp. NPDC048665]
ALKAVEHSIIVAIYHMLDRGQPYQDLGADYFIRRHSPDRQAAHHLAKLRDLGYQVTAEPPAA